MICRSFTDTCVCHEEQQSGVREHFGEFCKGTVRPYDLPKIHAFNFVLTRLLGGGETASRRRDPHGKTYASDLLRMKVLIPDDWDL